MSGKSSIEWTDATWNPVRGCVKISPGCKHCYAETFAERWRGVPGHAYERGFDPRKAFDQLRAPLRWRKPRRVFVNSMSDLFLEEFSNDDIAAVFGVMVACPQHEFQVLTKRAERMRAWFEWFARETHDRFAVPTVVEHAATVLIKLDEPASDELFRRCNAMAGRDNWLRNIRIGVSVEDRKYGVPRIEHLRACPGPAPRPPVPDPVRFLSIEPLLEDVGTIDLTGIQWVIAGAESGHGARPMQEDWVRGIRDQCTSAGVSFFYKQRIERGRKVSLPMLDGRQWGEFPEVRS